jgi:radical SAM protein with 4Fe4S-binding SPASM domain
MNFLAVEFGVNEPHIAVASLPDGHPLMPVGEAAEAMDRGFSDAVDLSVANILAERLSGGSETGPRLSYVADMMRALAERSATSAMCSAGTAQIVVDAHADVYPCWMFAGKPDFRMGNILEDGLERMLSGDVIARVLANTKLTNETCSTCYARFVCHACIGNNQIRTGFIEGVDPRFCDRTRRNLVTVLSAIATGHVEPKPQTVD